MTTPRFLQLIEHFVSNYTPTVRRNPITLDKAFQASESLELPSSTVFLQDINMSGYTLRVCGDTVFRESIADAVILSLGKIVIEGTSRNCTIFALDSIEVGKSETSLFVCYGDLVLGAETAGCESSTVGSIIGSQASILGGNMEAGNSIVVHSAYTATGQPPTTLSVGNRNLFMSTLRILNNYIQRLIDERNDTRQLLRDTVRTVASQQENGHLLAQLYQLRERQNSLEQEIEKQKQLLEELRRQATGAHTSESTISVLAYAGDNIAIDIGGRRFVTKEPLASVEFSVQGEEIAVGPVRYGADDDKITFIEL